MSGHPPSPLERTDYRRELEFARFSRVAYLDPGNVTNSDRHVNPDHGHLLDESLGLHRWEYVKTQDSNAGSGFVAHVFMQEFPDKRIVIAIRGSDNAADWTGPNLAVARDGELLDMFNLPAPGTSRTRAQMARVQDALLPGEAWDPQFRQALDLAREIKETYGAQGYRIVAVGHSMAGAHAQVISHTFGWDGRSFDAPGAANIVQSDGYRDWLAENDMRPAGTPGFRRDPFDSGFLNYKVNNSAVAYSTGPHLGDAQSISSFVGREGVGEHARYVAGIVGGGISQTPLVGQAMKATGAARLASVLGPSAHGARHGIDALDRHDIHRVVAVFEEAVRRQDRGDPQPLPIFGGEGERDARPVAQAVRGHVAPAGTTSRTDPHSGALQSHCGGDALTRFLESAPLGGADAFRHAARELCATPEATAWLRAGQARLQSSSLRIADTERSQPAHEGSAQQLADAAPVAQGRLR